MEHIVFENFGFAYPKSEKILKGINLNIRKGEIAAIYASGIPFNVSHGITTGIVLLFLGKPMIDKIERIKTKYGLCGG